MHTNRFSTSGKLPRDDGFTHAPAPTTPITSNQCLFGSDGSSCLSELGVTSSMFLNRHVIEHWDLPITSIVAYTPHLGSQNAQEFVFTGTSTLTWLTGLAPTASTSAAIYPVPSIAKVLPAAFLVFLLE